jgi:hypothetical protein
VFKTIRRMYFETASHVLCREVYYTVSLYRRVHYQRFHCSQLCTVRVIKTRKEYVINPVVTIQCLLYLMVNRHTPCVLCRNQWLAKEVAS